MPDCYTSSQHSDADAVLRAYQELHDMLGHETITLTFMDIIHWELQKIIDAIPDDVRIAIRPAGKGTEELLRNCDVSKKNIVGVYDRDRPSESFCGCPCFSTDEFSAEKCDCVLLTTLYWGEEIRTELRPSGILVIDIYEALRERGYPLILPFDFYRPESTMITNCYYLRYLRAKNSECEEKALRELLQVALELKDFVLIRKICEKAGGANYKYPILHTVQEKMNALLQMIGDCIQRREQDDIFLFFTDAVPIGGLDSFPEIKQLSKKGVMFQRAYAATQGTNYVMRSMYRGDAPIDNFDRLPIRVSRDNSPVIQYIEGSHCKIRFFGMCGFLEREYIFKTQNVLTSCNMIWWDSILEMLRSQERCFYVLHFTAESHPPHIYPDMLEVDYNTVGNKVFVTSDKQEQQMTQAYFYLDQCLLLYSKLAGNKTQVFFSDHGVGLWTYPGWSEERLHTYCFAIGKNIYPQTISEFFPSYRFSFFIKWLLEPEKYPLDDIGTDDVVFQEIDAYNQHLIRGLIDHNECVVGVSYRGVLNDRYKYVVNAFGDEYFYIKGENGEEVLTQLEDETMRREFRERCGTHFLDIFQIEKFEHSRKLYEYIRSVYPQKRRLELS